MSVKACVVWEKVLSHASLDELVEAALMLINAAWSPAAREAIGSWVWTLRGDMTGLGLVVTWLARAEVNSWG